MKDQNKTIVKTYSRNVIRNGFVNTAPFHKIVKLVGTFLFISTFYVQVTATSIQFELGETIYENSLSSPQDIEGWVTESSREGHPSITFPRDRMRLESDVHFLVWCPEEFPDNIAVSWDFWPRNDYGLAMFWIAATGKGDRKLFDSELHPREGQYSQYRMGDISALHVAYFRRNPRVRPFQIVSFRKSTPDNDGPVIARKPDPIPSARDVTEPYRIQVIKAGPHFQFSIYDHINDTNMVIVDWEDAGDEGPVLEGGKIGFRQMAGLIADHANLQVKKVLKVSE